MAAAPGSRHSLEADANDAFGFAEPLHLPEGGKLNPKTKAPVTSPAKASRLRGRDALNVWAHRVDDLGGDAPRPRVCLFL